MSGRALKKVVLELGSSDPFIVSEDADLDLTVETAVVARFQNTGQDCIAAKRFIVQQNIATEFTTRFLAAVATLKVSDPSDRDTKIGPMARDEFRHEIEQQVQQSLDMGASLLAGGHRLEGPGFFFEPTVLGDVVPGMRVFDEETFGPTAAIVVSRDDEESIDLANRSPYGLGASIWTRDIAKAELMARQIDAGMVFINGLVVSDPRLPFGGIKRSGYGRELSEFGNPGIRQPKKRFGLDLSADRPSKVLRGREAFLTCKEVLHRGPQGRGRIWHRPEPSGPLSTL